MSRPAVRPVSVLVAVGAAVALTSVGTVTANAGAPVGLHRDKRTASLAPNVGAAAAPRACGVVGGLLISLSGRDAWLFSLGKGRLTEVRLTLRAPSGETVTALATDDGAIGGHKNSRAVVRTAPAGSVLTAAEASFTGKGEGFELTGACPAKIAAPPPAPKPPAPKPPRMTHKPMPPAQHEPPPPAPTIAANPPADAPAAGDEQLPVGPLPSASPVEPSPSSAVVVPPVTEVPSSPSGPLDAAPKPISQQGSAGLNWTLVAAIAAGLMLLVFGLGAALLVRWVRRPDNEPALATGGPDDDTRFFDGLTS
jgi:hypothetical protein